MVYSRRIVKIHAYAPPVRLLVDNSLTEKLKCEIKEPHQVKWTFRLLSIQGKCPEIRQYISRLTLDDPFQQITPKKSMISNVLWARHYKILSRLELNGRQNLIVGVCAILKSQYASGNTISISKYV